MPVCNLPEHKTVIGRDGPYCWTCVDNEDQENTRLLSAKLADEMHYGEANGRQVGGGHYKNQIQHWDFAASHDFDYFQGQITKYVTRWKKKNGLQDLLKAKHFLDKYIELNTPKG
jgi:hypothetical protein